MPTSVHQDLENVASPHAVYETAICDSITFELCSSRSRINVIGQSSLSDEKNTQQLLGRRTVVKKQT